MTEHTGSVLLFARSRFRGFPRLTMPATASAAGAGAVSADAVVVTAPLAGTGSVSVSVAHTARASALLRGVAGLSATALYTAAGTAVLGADSAGNAAAVAWPTTGDPAALLPPNATVLERALALSMASAGPAPVPVRTLNDPAETDPEFMPFLAAHQSVDYWYPDWSEARRRSMVAEAIPLAALKGTREGTIRFLSYADGVLVDAISYPAPFVMARARVGRTPVGHPAFLARHLIRVRTDKPPRALTFRRGAVGARPVKTPDRDRIYRCLAAMRTSKTPETEYRADFAHKRVLQISDAPPLDGTYHLGQYLDRVKL